MVRFSKVYGVGVGSVAVAGSAAATLVAREGESLGRCAVDWLCHFLVVTQVHCKKKKNEQKSKKERKERSVKKTTRGGVEGEKVQNNFAVREFVRCCHMLSRVARVLLQARRVTAHHTYHTQNVLPLSQFADCHMCPLPR